MSTAEENVRHYQMVRGVGGEIKSLVLQVMQDSDRDLTLREIVEKVRPLLPESVTKRLVINPYYLTLDEIVESALDNLWLNDGKVEKRWAYYLHKRDSS